MNPNRAAIVRYAVDRNRLDGEKTGSIGVHLQNGTVVLRVQQSCLNRSEFDMKIDRGLSISRPGQQLRQRQITVHAPAAQRVIIMHGVTPDPAAAKREHCRYAPLHKRSHRPAPAIPARHGHLWTHLLCVHPGKVRNVSHASAACTQPPMPGANKEASREGALPLRRPRRPLREPSATRRDSNQRMPVQCGPRSSSAEGATKTGDRRQE